MAPPFYMVVRLKLNYIGQYMYKKQQNVQICELKALAIVLSNIYFFNLSLEL